MTNESTTHERVWSTQIPDAVHAAVVAERDALRADIEYVLDIIERPKSAVTADDICALLRYALDKTSTSASTDSVAPVVPTSPPAEGPIEPGICTADKCRDVVCEDNRGCPCNFAGYHRGRIDERRDAVAWLRASGLLVPAGNLAFAIEAEAHRVR